jgi:transposase
LPLVSRGAAAVIPPKNKRKQKIAYDFAMYAWRHLIENFFSDIKEFRRIATRYDKTDRSCCGNFYKLPDRAALNVHRP